MASQDQCATTLPFSVMLNRLCLSLLWGVSALAMMALAVACGGGGGEDASVLVLAEKRGTVVMGQTIQLPYQARPVATVVINGAASTASSYRVCRIEATAIPGAVNSVSEVISLRLENVSIAAVTASTDDDLVVLSIPLRDYGLAALSGRGVKSIDEGRRENAPSAESSWVSGVIRNQQKPDQQVENFFPYVAEGDTAIVSLSAAIFQRALENTPQSPTNSTVIIECEALAAPQVTHGPVRGFRITDSNGTAVEQTSPYIGTKNPLVLVRGIDASPLTGVPSAHEKAVGYWLGGGSESIVHAFFNDASMHSHFELFAVTYDWTQSIDTIGHELRDFLMRDILGTRLSNTVIVAHGLGGLVCRSAIQNHGMAFRRLVTLGTPHRGTPIGNSPDATHFMVRTIAPDGPVLGLGAALQSLRTGGASEFAAAWLVGARPSRSDMNWSGVTSSNFLTALNDVSSRSVLQDRVVAFAGNGGQFGSTYYQWGDEYMRGQSFHAGSDGLVPVVSALAAFDLPHTATNVAASDSGFGETATLGGFSNVDHTALKDRGPGGDWTQVFSVAKAGGGSPPNSDTWTPTSSANAPTARYAHSAVWTGSRMIVWGGTQSGTFGMNTGRVYDPSTDTWTTISTANAPSARSDHSAVWTGTRMIVWGGFTVGPLNTGGVYDPATDTWTATSTVNAPSFRYPQSAVWTGTHLIVWGGYDGAGGFFSSGGVYDPVSDTWTATSAVDAPSARSAHTAVWTGTHMIVWGGSTSLSGFTDSGGLYDPVADTWTAISAVSAPNPRARHTAVWTGSRMVVWGGSSGSAVFPNSGGIYDPATDTWTDTSVVNGPSGRHFHSAVWTGTHMIIWGGRSASATNSGGVYDPLTNTWTVTSASNMPELRERHSAVWTGTRMIVWGGLVVGPIDSGGSYAP